MVTSTEKFSELLTETEELRAEVELVENAAPVMDVHTHLFPPEFNELCLFGIDELLTYHYLVAEVYRVVPASKLPYADFWKMTKAQQADHIWKHLFKERSPISEACRGVCTTLTKLGMDLSDRNLDAWRKEEAKQTPSDYIDRVMQIANVNSITMTNPVFDENERNRWLADPDKLERVDGNTLRVRGTPAQLELAAAVVELVDGKGLGDSTRATGDGTVVARYDLKGVSSRNAIRHLRTMSIRQVVHVSEVSALLVSGSEEQIEAATLRMKVLRQENTAR